MCTRNSETSTYPLPSYITRLSINSLQLESPMRITAPERPIDAIDCAKEELTDALSLTRERGRVWGSENLSLQKLNSTEKKDRPPPPPLSHREMGEGTESAARFV